LDGHGEADGNARRSSAAGGTLALGNDAGYLYGLIVGMPMNEIRALEAVGFTPMEIITSATVNAAAVCRLSDLLEEGKQADVLVVDGDPLMDLEVLTAPLLVIHRGTVIVDNR